MIRVIKALCFLFVLSILLPIDPVFALTNNTQPLIINGAPVTEIPLVQHANVMTMTTDYGMSGAIVWRLKTTDPNTSPYTQYNECSSTSSTQYVNFYVNATLAASDNKLQKLMSLLQVAQLTGMQVTLMGTQVTGNTVADCIYSNITDVYLRNTTY